MPQIFPNGIQGLSDSKWAGVPGSAYRLVGIDYRSTPGLTKVHQKLTKDSGATIGELCKVQLAASDGSTLHFSSESGKIWRESGGTYTLVHTTVPTAGEAACSGAEEYDGDIYWATEKYLHKIAVGALGLTWATNIEQNYGEFANGLQEHPMCKQNLALYVADGRDIGIISIPSADTAPPAATQVAFTGGPTNFSQSQLIVPVAGQKKFPRLTNYVRTSGSSGAALSYPFEVESGYKRVLVVTVSAWRTDSATPANPTATYGGVSMTEVHTRTGTSDTNDVYRVTTFKLLDPDVGTDDIDITWSGSETHLVLHAYQFVDASDVVEGAFDVVSYDGGETTGDLTSVLEGITDNSYYVRLSFARSYDSTHTWTDVEILNGTNSFDTSAGRDSAAVSTLGVLAYQDTTAFKTISPEYVNTLTAFDTDILVGTKIDNQSQCRVLRWDTVSSGYSADDTIYEDGVNAFVTDDNYVYAQVGSYGRFYYYDGERLQPLFRMPGDWSPTKRAMVNRNAVAFHLGVPLFGLSNIEGNPALQGVYGFGKYSENYRSSLSLGFPISSGDFSGVEIGSVITRGADVWVAWKVGSTAGVDKLDWSSKYTGAYIETGVLTPSEARNNLKTLLRSWVNYVTLPASTNVTISYEKKYDGFTALTSKNDATLNQIEAKKTIPDVAALRLKFDFTVSGNDAPEVEGFGFGATSKQQR